MVGGVCYMRWRTCLYNAVILCVFIVVQVVADLQYNPMTVFQLLLNTASLEHDLTQIYKRLVSEKVIT